MPNYKVNLFSSEYEREVISFAIEKYKKDSPPNQADFQKWYFENYLELLNEMVEIQLVDIKTDMKNDLTERRNDSQGFKERLNNLWEKPFELLEYFIELTNDAVVMFNDEVGKNEGVNSVYGVLIELCSRACQVSREILVLMRSGYADGAHARWRTLHELVVTAFFIKKHGLLAAEMYLSHDHIESYKGALVYQSNCEKLGTVPYSSAEIEQLKKSYDDLVEKYGIPYSKDYGWASVVLKDVNFRSIEEDVELHHLRPYYKMASIAVHANSKSRFFSLGQPGKTKTLLTGPSNEGMADPGHGVAVSLCQITSVLLTQKTTAFVIVFLKAQKKLADELGEEFLKVHKLAEEIRIKRKG